jgi:hypothetical protein
VPMATAPHRCRHPGASCVLRIRADDPEAGISFGIKFGASPEEYGMLIQAAVTLKLKVTGVSFHVGSLASLFLLWLFVGCLRVLFSGVVSCHYRWGMGIAFPLYHCRAANHTPRMSRLRLRLRPTPCRLTCAGAEWQGVLRSNQAGARGLRYCRGPWLRIRLA